MIIDGVPGLRPSRVLLAFDIATPDLLTKLLREENEGSTAWKTVPTKRVESRTRKPSAWYRQYELDMTTDAEKVLQNASDRLARARRRNLEHPHEAEGRKT